MSAWTPCLVTFFALNPKEKGPAITPALDAFNVLKPRNYAGLWVI